MPDITKIKIGNERERSYKDFPANREFKKRAEDDNPGGGGGTADHRELTNRDAANQHPISAIEGLANYVAAKVLSAGVSGARYDSDTETLYLSDASTIRKRTFTQDDAFWNPGHKRAKMLPVYMPSGTVLSFNTELFDVEQDGYRFKVYQYLPSNPSADVNGFVVSSYVTNKNTFTVTNDCYVVIDVDTLDICAYNTLTGVDSWHTTMKTYGYPVKFSFECGIDYEPNYVLSTNWRTSDIAFGSDYLQVFSNGLNYMCAREQGQPLFVNKSGFGLSPWNHLVSSNLTLSGTLSQGYASDIMSFGDELWVWTTGADTPNTSISNVAKFRVYDNGWVQYLGQMWTDLGHMNAIHYLEDADIAMWGNGSANYDLEGVVYMLEHFSESALATSYCNEIVLLSSLTSCQSLSVPIATYGFKPNCIPSGIVAYGNSWNNSKESLIVTLLTNDGNTMYHGYILAENDESGKTHYDLSAIVFGNAINIGDTSESKQSSYVHCVQGMTAVSGKVYWGVGHSGHCIATETVSRSNISSAAVSHSVSNRIIGNKPLDAGMRGVTAYRECMWYITDHNISHVNFACLPN